MKKIFFSFLCLSLVGCSAVRFKGTPVVVSSRMERSIALNDKQKQQWSRLDIELDSVPGMSVNRAFNELIVDKKGGEVIVAVIDSGMDTSHPALAGQIWTNSDEIPNNQIDDDQNGYIDDVHGWNFLGDVENENLEYVRLQKKEDPESDAFQAYEKKRQKELKKKHRSFGECSFFN